MTVISSCSRSNHRFCKKIQLLLAIVHPLSGWSIEESGCSIRRKDECQIRLKGRERDFWIGTEIGMLGGYGFQGQVAAGDGSDQKGKMGAGYNNLK